MKTRTGNNCSQPELDASTETSEESTLRPWEWKKSLSSKELTILSAEAEAHEDPPRSLRPGLGQLKAPWSWR